MVNQLLIISRDLDCHRSMYLVCAHDNVCCSILTDDVITIVVFVHLFLFCFCMHFIVSFWHAVFSMCTEFLCVHTHTHKHRHTNAHTHTSHIHTQSYVQIWDRRTLELKSTLLGHKQQVRCLQFNEQIVMSGSSDNSVK